MKKTFLCFFLLVGAGLMAFGQEVEIKESQSYCYAYIECQGSYQQIPAKIGEFMQAFFSQQLISNGDLMGIYFNSPAQVKEEELKWQIGMPVAKDTAVKEPLKKGDLSFTHVAVYTHIGPYDQVANSYAKMIEFIGKNGYQVAGPIIEKYLDDPSSVKPENLRTIINIPVTKK